MAGIFLTGTDTEIGKTQVACALLKAINKRGISAVGMKPVASGAVQVDNTGNDSSMAQWQNEDATNLIQASAVQLPYETINPYLFKEPVSPHIAAALEHRNISLDIVASCYSKIEQQAKFVVVEGVGGWLAPLNDQQTVEDMALRLQLPVVLVVGMRLGCLNHAILTAQRIQQSGLVLAGWVANSIDSQFSFPDENINTLTDRVNAPLIGQLDFAQKDFDERYEESISVLVNA